MTKPVPAWLLALGRCPPPASITVGGANFDLIKTFKTDFFAATCLYQGPLGKVVLKIGRQHSLWGLPMQWVGRFLYSREARLIHMAQGIEGIPRLIGRWGTTGLVHEYVEGRPLAKGDRPDDNFFPRLSEILDRLHARRIAYVDLEKPENVLLGDDGKPYLFDFQISWHLPPNRLGDTWIALAVLGVLQSADRYHLLKHWRKFRPDQLPPEQLWQAGRPPFWIRWHRMVFRPLTLARRKILVWMGVRESVKVRSPG